MEIRKQINVLEMDTFRPDEQKIKKIIIEGDFEILNQYSKELAKDLNEGEKMTTCQIRKILDEIQKMRSFDKNKLQLIRPKLAYAVAKTKKGKRIGKILHFQKVVEEALKFTNKDNFENFKYFIEAIVAYHRYFGED